MSIRITFSGDDRVQALLQRKRQQIFRALELKINSLMLRLQAKIQGEKLSGQVLKQRTGTLKRSIEVIPVEQKGDALAGGVRGGGGPAFYGRFHEYGTSNSYTIVPVNKKALAFIMGGKQVIVKKVVHPPFPERSFMRSSLEEMNDEIVTELKATIRRVFSATPGE
jgi:hypothetical protein